jgi:hypothetical protein
MRQEQQIHLREPNLWSNTKTEHQILFLNKNDHNLFNPLIAEWPKFKNKVKIDPSLFTAPIGTIKCLI